MAYNRTEQHIFGDDDSLPKIDSETESNLQRLFVSGSTQADSIYFGLDQIFSQSILSTAPTNLEDAFSQSDNLSQSASTFETPRRRKTRSRSSSFSPHTVNILEEWLETHSEKPYPTKDEKARLAQRTGLAVVQVSTWFANARRRYKHGSLGNRVSEPEPLESLHDFQPSQREEWLFMNPLDRWENSPPEIEPAPLEAIMNAVASSESNSPYGQSSQPTSLAADSREEHTSVTGNDAQSIVSLNQSQSALSSSSNSSIHSFNSNISGGSFGCFYLEESLPRRRRRRRRGIKTAATQRRPFQCTFCTDTFRTKHDWTRHEKTLHLSLETFTCAPSGSTYTSPRDGTSRCVFCDEPCPTSSHTEMHRFEACQQKPSSYRTFYRKDHLIQHLRLLHGVTQPVPVIDMWKSQVEHVNSRCGFCEERFTVWSERNDHIARHFRDGAAMKDWQGCRGLDPPVALAVENAMPPYLIGIESTGMNPFSASRIMDATGKSSFAAGEPCNPTTTKHNPTPFEYLTACLTRYVQETSATGQIVTDDMLQNEARRILYCDDDPWNQTPADNSEWLRLFKEGVGLGDGSEIHLGFSNNLANEDFTESSFCLPWSADHWSPTQYHDNADLLDINGTDMAWPWQSPECLAEFRRNLEALSAGLIGEEGDASEAHYSTMHLSQV